MCFETAVVMVRVNFLNQFNMKLVTFAMRRTRRVRLIAEMGWEEMKVTHYP